MIPKMNVPLKLQDKRTPESDSLGLENEYEYRRLMAYLKANSLDEDRPFKAFSVSRRFYRMLVLQIDDITGCYHYRFRSHAGR